MANSEEIGIEDSNRQREDASAERDHTDDQKKSEVEDTGRKDGGSDKKPGADEGGDIGEKEGESPSGKKEKEKDAPKGEKDVEEEEEKEEKDKEGEKKKKKEKAAEVDIKESEEYKSLNEKYLRLYAEFDNFRKRTAKENLELIQTANCNLLEKLIPTLENFGMAFSPGQKAQKLEDFETGIKMIYNSFRDVLEEAGLEEINPEGEEFDPMYHEAMLEQYHDTMEEGNIIQVYQKGYKVKSRILKHAKVVTSKGRDPNKKADKKTFKK